MLNWNDNKILDTEWCTLFGLQFIIFFLSISYINNLGDDDNLQICLFLFFYFFYSGWKISRLGFVTKLSLCLFVCVCVFVIYSMTSQNRIFFFVTGAIFVLFSTFHFFTNLSLYFRFSSFSFVFLVHVIVYHYFDVCVSVSV